METARCKAFLWSVEKGSFSRAAEALNYTPSGVSQLVSALEKELGVSLLRRTRQGVFPTENGEMLIPVIRSLLENEARIYELSDEINGLLTGSITIAAFPSIATHWLPALIREFEQMYPGIRIQLREGSRESMLKRLSEQTADLAFNSYLDPQPYDWIPLAEDRMVAILPENHPLAQAPDFPIERFREEPMILASYGTDTEPIKLLSEFGIQPEIRFTTTDYYTAMSMVEQGLGITLLNELITENWNCRIVKLPLRPARSLPLGISIPSMEEASPAVRRFADFVRERMGAPGATDGFPGSLGQR